MCGITGHWGYDTFALSVNSFSKLNDRISHRGPDGSGTKFFETDRLWLGHRRLSIIDLSSMGE